MVYLGDDNRLHCCIWLAAFDLPQIILTILTDQDICPQQDAVMPFGINVCNIAPYHSPMMTNESAPPTACGLMKALSCAHMS